MPLWSQLPKTRVSHDTYKYIPTLHIYANFHPTQRVSSLHISNTGGPKTQKFRVLAQRTIFTWSKEVKLQTSGFANDKVMVGRGGEIPSTNVRHICRLLRRRHIAIHPLLLSKPTASQPADQKMCFNRLPSQLLFAAFWLIATMGYRYRYRYTRYFMIPAE